MTTKTTSTTNDAGVPPAPPEAHQRAGGDEEWPNTGENTTTCHGCIHLIQDGCEDGVGWCNYHWQYKSIRMPRVCDGAQFFDQEGRYEMAHGKTAAIQELQRDYVALLLSDDKAFGKAMAHLIAYVRKHAVEANFTLEAAL